VAATLPVRRRVRVHRWLALKNGGITLLLLAALIAGAPIATSAATAAAWMLFTRRVKPAKVFALIDWELLVMFAGLFVVVGGLEQAGLKAWIAAQLAATPALIADRWFVVASVVLSNVVSNVPAVLLLKQVIHAFPHPDHAWLLLALSSTFAGNLTIPGSIANLIVVEAARRRGIDVPALAYLRIGVPLTLLTIAVGIGLLVIGR
jgi:Na+/H+ antiporter NhaD/arsenite permease-like protein